MAKLNGKQEKFLKEYLTNGYKGTEAAISAGYSEKAARTTASKLLKHPLIMERLEGIQEKEEEKFEFTREDMYKKLKKMADGKEEEITRIYDGNGNLIKETRQSLKKDGTQMLTKFFGFEAPIKMDHTGSFDVETTIDFSGISTNQLKEALGRK